MEKPTIFYGYQDYFSHRRCAFDYFTAINKAYNVSQEPTCADVVILHYEPHLYEQILTQAPYLKDKYLIGFAVWEADTLPQIYRKGISLMDEIWTPSHFSLKAFEQSHEKVSYLPHMVRRDMEFSIEDLRTVKGLIGYDERLTYFLNISKLSDKRKNIQFLINAFQQMEKEIPRARLILKNHDGKSYQSRDDRIIIVNRILSPQQINALYHLTNVYVSAHHGEGWGLTLSDAMLFGKTVIGTGYSGNLEFMNSENSHLLDYSLINIRPEDCFGLFTEEMKWAYPIEKALARRMIEAYESMYTEHRNRMLRKAEETVRRFSLQKVSKMICEALDRI